MEAASSLLFYPDSPCFYYYIYLCDWRYVCICVYMRVHARMCVYVRVLMRVCVCVRVLPPSESQIELRLSDLVTSASTC